MNVCTVIDPGFLSTVQDRGRTGYRAFGMPLAGAMDHYAFTMANILAGNNRNTAALEMTLRGARFRFTRAAYVAICGAEMQAQLNGRPVKNWSAFRVAPNDDLAFGYAVSGCRGYLAFHGGISLPKIMGSSSTYLRAQVGGYEGRALKSGDVLELPDTELPSETIDLPVDLAPSYANDVRLRVMLGPQDELFTGGGIATFLGSVYTVTARNDRMGYVLDGPTIAHKGAADIISDALCPGAIQVPGSGTPMVMGADCQTTGGYAKIAVVIAAELPKLAQTKAGDRLSFVSCGDEEAVAALIAEQESYKKAAHLIHAIDRSQL